MRGYSRPACLEGIDIFLNERIKRSVGQNWGPVSVVEQNEIEKILKGSSGITGSTVTINSKSLCPILRPPSWESAFSTASWDG